MYKYKYEFYHHGVKGMRWGHRKRRLEEEKQRLATRSVRTDAGVPNQQQKPKQFDDIDDNDSFIDADTRKNIQRTIATANNLVTFGGQAAKVYNNAKKVAEISAPFVKDATKVAVKVTNKALDVIGDIALKDLNKNLNGMRID